ncbi:MAG: 3-hydroxyacyl-CoA dehydrogenase family protein [Sarcina sp.]
MKNTIGILGTGTMGKSLGLLCLKSNKTILVFSRSKSSSSKFLEYIKNNLSENEMYLLENLNFCYELDDLANTSFIIEVLIEDLKFKQTLFEKLDTILPSNIILASSTSALLPSEIAEKMKNKNRFIVTHFWNPAHVVPLVEIVPSDFTDEYTIRETKKLLEELNKKTVMLLKECPGFIGNRIQLAIIREATKIFSEGLATATDIDNAIKYSLAPRYAVTGPLESCDLGGLDIFYNVSKSLYDDLSNESNESALLKEYVQENKLGAKTGQGFYNWTEEKINEATNKRLAVVNSLSKY